MISVKCTVNVQSIPKNNQSTISIVFNQIKCESNKLKSEKYFRKPITQLSKQFLEK